MKMSNKQFNIQIPTQIVRSSKFTSGEFILLAKILQAYYSQTGKEKSLTFTIDHKAFMYFLFFKDNNTFKKNIKKLCDMNIIENEINNLPRKGGLEITLNKVVIPEYNKERGYFTQLPYFVLNREVIEGVGYVGVRLLYYYKSYINAKDFTKQYCFVAESTTATDLNITEKTVIKYNKFLKDRKFVKIEKHKLHELGSYSSINGKEVLNYIKYNNHYILQMDKVEKFCDESRSLLTQNS
jgi:hypothetical protein